MNIRTMIKILIIFFKIGMLTIGGGLVMIPVMKREFVDKQKWLNDEEMADVFAVAQSLPGVIAINSSVYVGYKVYGIAGGIVAAIGIVMPSFLCILVIYFALSSIGDNIYLAKFYTGVRAAIVALISVAAYNLGKSAVKDIFGLFVAAFGILATVFLKIDIAYIVLLSGLVGYLYYSLCKGSMLH